MYSLSSWLHCFRGIVGGAKSQQSPYKTRYKMKSLATMEKATQWSSQLAFLLSSTTQSRGTAQLPFYIDCWSRARNDLRAWTLGFACAKGLISGLTRRPDPCHDFNVLPNFGCILVDSARCQPVGTTHALDHTRWVWKGGSDLKGGSAPCSVVLLTRAHR